MVIWRNTVWQVHVVGLGWKLTLKKMKKCSFKTWRGKNFWIFYLTGCKALIENLAGQKKNNAESDASEIFQFEIWQVVNFSIQNHASQKRQKKAKYVVFAE